MRCLLNEIIKPVFINRNESRITVLERRRAAKLIIDQSHFAEHAAWSNRLHDCLAHIEGNRTLGHDLQLFTAFAFTKNCLTSRKELHVLIGPK